MRARFFPYRLTFKNPAGTSRGVMKEKQTYFLKIEGQNAVGWGECGVFKGLSADDRPDFESKLQWVCDHIELGLDPLLLQTREFPAIQMGLETAFLSWGAAHPFVLFPSDFTRGLSPISINGLIWMGTEIEMKKQIEDKIAQGFRCIKLKIGAIDFDSECRLLAFIRKHFPADKMEIRVDANGAFKPSEALEKLNMLSSYDLHSIEQPIKAGQLAHMKTLCKQSPLPIALDEELIGVFDISNKKSLLEEIMPQYIILKPTLVGGFQGSMEWIETAEKLGIGWWITSALESNIGLNAIAQWTYTLKSKLPQGLGTGSLFTNNIPAPLVVKNGFLNTKPDLKWDISALLLL
ncbi:MAG: o-succinylbenzoate synthase [Bacteroidetes bacterium]|nr:o-succinylbenzoate synthase [Bacteroidota bacterium]